MNCKKFIDSTILSLDEKRFNELKDNLVDKYIPFLFVDKKEVNEVIFAEKLYDYFEKLDLRTGRSFEKVLEKYTQDLDSIVGCRIATAPKAKKNMPAPKMPRARTYYEEACAIKKISGFMDQLLDYSRIMLCLYTSIMNNNYYAIYDFDFSLKNIDLGKIVESMLNKEMGLVGKKPRFDIKYPYNSDRSTFIILIIMFYCMKDKEIVGEY